MSEERKKILGMLAEGKISVDDAERLLSAVDREDSPQIQERADSETEPANPKKPKWLRIQVDAKSGNGVGHGHGKREHVNIRIPIGLIKAGVKLGAVLPDSAKDKLSGKLGEHGMHFDLNKIDSENIDEILAAISEMSIDVDDEEETVRIFCE